jgi:hypothetical protein
VSVILNVLQFAFFTAIILVGGYFFLKKFDKKVADKIDSKIEELKAWLDE